MTRRSTPIALIAALLTVAAPAAGAGDPWEWQAKLIASDGGADHLFGQAVALSGDTALVSRQDPTFGPQSVSRVYVFVHDGEDWIEQATLFPDDHPIDCSGTAQCPYFGWSVALDGDVAVVGAPSFPAITNDQPGVAYIFVRDGEVWSQQAKLTASDGTPDDKFGQSVAVSGDIVLIGAPAAEVDGLTRQGSAYVFVFDGQDWIEQAQLAPADDFPVDPCANTTCPFFGNAVALLGDTALVGAENMRVDGNNRQGAAFVFTRDGGVWTEQAMLTAADSNTDHRFGSAVAIAENVSLVGAKTATIDFPSQGAAYVFMHSAGGWSQEARLLASDAESLQNLGNAVALVDGAALVGAVRSSNAGAAYLYTVQDESWVQQFKLTAPDGTENSRFGYAVALSGGTAFVNDLEAEVDGNNNHGAVYVFVARTVGEPTLIFDPDSLDFGDVEVGSTSTPLGTTLSSIGDGDVTGLVFDAPGNGFAADTGDCGDNLPGGASCQISITFTPGASGPAADSLHVDSDQGASAELTLAGNGTDGGPTPGVLEVTPLTHDFGAVEVGDSETMAVTVINTAEPGAESLTLDAVDLAGEAVFAVTGGDCAVGTVLGPEGSCTVDVTFSPDSQESFSGALTVETEDDQGATATLQGSGSEATTDPTTVMVSLQPDGSPFTGETWDGVIDANGRYVAFIAAGGSGGGSPRAYRRDLLTATTEPVSVNIEGGVSPVHSGSGRIAISADGRYVFFRPKYHPDHPPPVPEGPPGYFYVRDMDAGVTEFIDMPTTDGELPDDGGEGAITMDVSADGRIMTFASKATNLVPGGGCGVIDGFPLRCVYVFDRDANAVELVSVAFDGGELDENVYSPSISADGRYVGFRSAATNLVPGDTNEASDVFLYDRTTATTERISVASDGSEGNHRSGTVNGLDVSADGRYVVFMSLATNLIPDDANGPFADAFIRDRATGTTGLVSVASDGTQGNSASRYPRISSDDRFVAFESTASNLVSGDTNGKQDSFIHDRATGVTERVSVASDGTQGDGHSVGVPTVSAGGRFVGFPSSASNLAPTDGNGAQIDFFVRDRGGPAGIALAVVPGLLDFGAVPVGMTGGPASVTLTSVGGEAVTVSEVSSPAAPFAAVGGSCEPAPFTLSPGESCTLDFTFVPTGPGPVSSSVSIASTVPSSPDVVTLQGTGVEVHAELVFDPPSLDFGDVEVGASSPPQSATLSNTGEADANELAFGLTGDGGFEADTSACGSTLSVDGSCEVTVTFAPVAPGEAAAALEATSPNAVTAALSLSGHATGEGFTPMALEVDTEELLSDGNRIFEPGETVKVAPAWRNDDATAQSLTGAATSFTGPAGASYLVAADEADYGLIEPGTTTSCLETGLCYHLAVNHPTVRPATHWQATFEESLADETSRTWSLHIAESFTDVPPANLFYPSIETLLHHGVTGGCRGTEYCPNGSNTRAQMAIFLLRGIEDADYQPSACEEGNERFEDVAFDSIFCPWVEELAERQITSGCGDDNFCPSASVTRAQMALFLLKAAEGVGFTPPDCAGEFTDVPCPSLFANWIEELAAREITGGCGDGAYCPNDVVTRGQMAVFITRAFGLALYGP